MRRKTDAQTAAREFATTLRTLLNRTVTSQAHVGCLPIPDTPGRFTIANNLNPRNLEGQPIKLNTARQGAYCWLKLVMSVFVDHRRLLTVHSSSYQIRTGPSAAVGLFRFDYERGKSPYAEAHLQIDGDSSHLQELMAALGKPKTPLHKLHFPVGGRRYRPALEDVLEFLIVEGIVTPVPDWQLVLGPSREAFRRRQLSAAIWREPDVAREALRSYEEWEKVQDTNVVPHERRRRWRSTRSQAGDH